MGEQMLLSLDYVTSRSGLDFKRMCPLMEQRALHHRPAHGTRASSTGNQQHESSPGGHTNLLLFLFGAAALFGEASDFPFAGVLACIF